MPLRPLQHYDSVSLPKRPPTSTPSMPLSSTTPCRASHRRASPARPAGFHGTQHAPQPPRRTQRTYVYILLRPNPRAHMHTRTRLALAQSRTSSTCALSCHWTELRAMPVSQQCCAPFSLCRHLPSSHNRRAHSRYARDSLSHVESCRARARARGWWAASLPRSLAPSLAHKILHPISLVFRDAERARTVERTSTSFRTQRATTTLRAAAAMCMRSAA